MESEKPLVTVATLSYRKFEYIYEAIDSVLQQDYEKIEYIIADDGSENFPKDSIEHYIKTNKKNNICSFSIIDRKENVGTVRNINDVWRNAKGTILIPLSADDVFASNDVLTKIVNRMEEKNYDILVCNRILCDEELKQIGNLPYTRDLNIIKSLDTPEKQFKAFATGQYYKMASGSVLYMKKSVYDMLGGFDETYKLWEDGPFLVKCTRNGYKINTAYDIDAIFYRDGGVSSGKPNVYLLEDMKLLAWRNMQDKKRLTISERRDNKMTYNLLMTTAKKEKILVCLKYMDICVMKLLRKIINRIVYY